MDIQKEREEFETFYKTKILTADHEIAMLDQLTEFHIETGLYEYARMQTAWETWQAAKSQAVPEGRTDIQIIEQTIGIVRLIGESNSFECANSKVFPFESKSPRLQVWWRVACEIQELLTDTDPNNCDFEEYKAMVEAQEQSHEH